jgi:hypothetical protein
MGIAVVTTPASIRNTAQRRSHTAWSAKLKSPKPTVATDSTVK